MKLIEDWKLVLKKAWSMRAAYIGALVAAGDAILAQVNGHVPWYVYLALMLVFILARVAQQS